MDEGAAAHLARYMSGHDEPIAGFEFGDRVTNVQDPEWDGTVVDFVDHEHLVVPTKDTPIRALRVYWRAPERLLLNHHPAFLRRVV
jgi:hypothetical protein